MTDLVCLPAIDIRNGKCVRLLQGRFSDETVFGDPVVQAKRYVDEGATWLHLVDLDAARRQSPENRSVIASIVESAGIAVEIGGGIRDEETASFYLGVGARRVIVGTAAIEQPELIESLVSRYPGRIGLGLDHRAIQTDGSIRRQVSVRGWEVETGVDLDTVLADFEYLDIGAVIVTDIERDGMMSGPDLDGYAELLGNTDLPLIASGGIKGLDDLRALALLEHDGRRLVGAVVGRALLSAEMTLDQALAACVR